MMEFKKLDNHDSAFSASVWEEINNHLEAQRLQRKKAIFLVRLITFLLPIVILITYLVLNSLELGDSVQFASNICSGETEIVCNLESNSNQKEANIENKEVHKTESFNTVNYYRELDTEESISDITLAVDLDYSNSYENEIKPLISFHDEETKLLSSKIELLKPSIPVNTLIDPPTSISSLSFKSVCNENLRDFYNRDGCNSLEPKAIKRYGWSQVSGFTPIASYTSMTSKYQDYALARNHSVNPLPSADISIGVGVKNRIGVFLESGLKIAQWREEFAYVDPESISFQTIITIDTIYSQQGLEVSSDTTSIQINNGFKYAITNTNTSLSLPILLGFERQVASRLSIALRIGAIINLKMLSNISLIDEEMNIVNINRIDEQRFSTHKNKIKTMIQTGVGLTYHYSPMVEVYFSTEISVTPATVLSNTNILSKKYLVPGLAIGLRYYL